MHGILQMVYDQLICNTFWPKTKKNKFGGGIYVLIFLYFQYNLTTPGSRQR